MTDLLEAIQIFLKYGNPSHPFHCEHDILTVDIDPDLVSEQDMNRLDDLGFFVSTEHDGMFSSYKYGSC